MFTWLFLADDHRLAVVTGLTPMWFDAMLTMLLSFQRYYSGSDILSLVVRTTGLLFS